MTSDQLRGMLDDPAKLYRFAESAGLAVSTTDTPQQVVSKLMQLAVRVDNIPDYANM